MNSNLEQAIVAAWAVKNLPARLDVETTAKVLGFAEHDIQILMAARKLTPLGDPAPNAKMVLCDGDDPIGSRPGMAEQGD